MPESFDDTTVLGALNRSIMTATHLEPKHAGAVAAARALAAKIDAWDTIVQWALDDAAVNDRRPSVPANDNTSLPSFLKYLEALQLVPPAAEKAKPGPASTASPAQQALNEMRKGLSRFLRAVSAC